MLAPEGACLVISALWRVGQMKVDETQWCNMLLDFLSQLGVTDGISLVWRHTEGVLYHRNHGWCTNSVLLLSAVMWISVTVPEIINKMCPSVQLRTASMSPISPPSLHCYQRWSQLIYVKTAWLQQESCALGQYFNLSIHKLKQEAAFT